MNSTKRGILTALHLFGVMIRMLLPLLLTTRTTTTVDCFQQQQQLSSITQKSRGGLLVNLQRRQQQQLQQQQHGTSWGGSIGVVQPSSFLLLKSTTSSNTDSSSTAKDSEKEESSSQSKSDDNFIKEELEDITESTDDDDQQKKFSMPWSQNQEWALKDNLSKYTIMVPLKNNNKQGIYALWRTMLKEVPELTGYPIEFLQERCIDSDHQEESDIVVPPPPGILPYLDDYEFTTSGGISGQVYGIPGLADGTRIETSAVTNIEVTLVKGFVVTSDSSTAYELGRPKREEFTMRDTSTTNAMTAAATKGGGELLKSVSQNMPSDVTEDADGMLLRLGATTGILLAGATAMNMLAHHLTVNVFWV